MPFEFPESQHDLSKNMEFLPKGDFAVFDPTLYPAVTSNKKRGRKKTSSKSKRSQ